MTVFVALLVGAKFAPECERPETIEDIKHKIEDRTGMSRISSTSFSLEEVRMLSDYNVQKENTLHLVAGQVGRKPVVYFFPPSHSRRDLSTADARADSEYFDPTYLVLDCDTPTAILLSFADLLPYLNATLKALLLPTATRDDFITYRLLKLSKKPCVALRFPLQAAYERAAELEVEPKPDVITRVFMLFRGLSEENANHPMWAAARTRVGQVDWVKIVGLDEGV